MSERSLWTWVSAALVIGLIVSSYFGLYYYTESMKYQQLYQGALSELMQHTVLVNILIDYGNGTKTWYNSTRVPLGASLFNATEIVVSLEYTKYEWGVFMTSLNGLSADQGHGWLWYVWNPAKGEWDFGPVGADQFILKSGDTVSWVYTAW